MTPVTIDREDLEILLHFARMGDAKGSQRLLCNGFRHVSVCSGEHQEPSCRSCKAFMAAESLLGPRGLHD